MTAAASTPAPGSRITIGKTAISYLLAGEHEGELLEIDAFFSSDSMRRRDEAMQVHAFHLNVQRLTQRANEGLPIETRLRRYAPVFADVDVDREAMRIIRRRSTIVRRDGTIQPAIISDIEGGMLTGDRTVIMFTLIVRLIEQIGINEAAERRAAAQES